jgi:hypothetical protein
MTKFYLKRRLPDNIVERFEDGSLAHVICITHKYVDGRWQENVVTCMSSRHEYIDRDGRDDNPGGDDPEPWSDLLGTPDDLPDYGKDGCGEPADRDPWAQAASTDTASANPAETPNPATLAPAAATATPTALGQMAAQLQASLSTSYRKCKTTGLRCYLLVTSSRLTCRKVGGSATGLPLCSD